MKTIKYARKPIYVDVVQVTAESLFDVAEWCKGTVQTNAEGESFVKVKVHRPRSNRQTEAFIGDYVLYSNTGFKVYTPKAFKKSFEKVHKLSKAQADEAGIRPPIEKPTPVDRFAS